LAELLMKFYIRHDDDHLALIVIGYICASSERSDLGVRYRRWHLIDCLRLKRKRQTETEQSSRRARLSTKFSATRDDETNENP
jgi:hypothetical protein